MESTPPTDVNAAIAANTPESTTVQDSSIFSYICDLSPIKPVNAASVEQGFRGLNSPPLVFQSPQINTQTSLDLKRTHCPLSLSQHGDGDKGKINPTGADECGKSDSQLSCQLNPQTYKVCRSNSSRRDQTLSSTGSREEYLDDFLADYKYSTRSANSESRLSDDVSRLLDGSTNSTDVNIANKEDEQDLATAVQASPAKFEQAKEENQGSLSSHLKPVENDDLRHSEPVNESFQWYNEYGQTTGVVVPDRPVVNNKTYIPKATQSEVRKRKRLQFEEAHQNFIGDGSCFWNPSNSPCFSYASPGYSDDPGSSFVNFPATPSNMQLGNMSQSKDRNLMSTVSKPSGIGLHLNSIVNALPLSSTAKIKVADGSCLTVGGSASSASCPSPYISKPSLKIVEHRATSDISGKANSEHSGIIEASYQASNKKKRKKTSETSDGDGCKRCNCKKTQCLKLYCDCFAAGIYCDDPCACQGCFNRPEYDETVIDTRQQIESRNPLAFAPKIIQRLTQVPAIRSREDGRRSAPLSGRHKKGCNCKKSTCLKKYCECYQANVGCSDACRCEGCKNIYGRKGEYKITREADSIETINDKSGSSSEQKSELESTTNNCLFPEFQNPQSSTPVTPLFQSSDHGADASKSQLYSARYLPSPESCTTLLPPHVNVPGSPNNTAPREKIQETRKYVLDHEPDYENVEIVGESLPKRRKLGNICHLNSLPTYSASDTPISFESSKTRDLVNNSGLQNSRPQFGSGSGQHWRGLPLTPETRLCDILEDETPQILKENQTMCNTVKVRSPNKKRVSPPISCSSTSSLTPLKSGHMILKAIPSFPSLNPCMGSKNRTNEKMKDPQNARNNE